MFVGIIILKSLFLRINYFKYIPIEAFVCIDRFFCFQLFIWHKSIILFRFFTYQYVIFPHQNNESNLHVIYYKFTINYSYENILLKLFKKF